MVGSERFQAHFAAFTDQYVLIGGTATQLVLDEQGLEEVACMEPCGMQGQTYAPARCLEHGHKFGDGHTWLFLRLLRAL